MYMNQSPDQINLSGKIQDKFGGTGSWIPDSEKEGEQAKHWILVLLASWLWLQQDQQPAPLLP